MWFLQHDNFRKWIESDYSTLLWVSANPGCGKSVLAKYLIDQEKALEATKSRTTCYFFFKDDNEEQNSVTTALSALLHQLFSQKESLIQHAMKDYKSEGNKLPQLFHKLWNILLMAASDSKAGEIVCILDGLDECTENARYQFIDALSAFYKRAISEKGGSRLKFLITSRPYYDIERRFAELIRNFPSIRVPGENESKAIGHEIDTVIKWKLSKLALELRLNASEQSTLEAELLSMTHRTYLWAKLVFDILYRTIRPTSRRLKEIVRSIPPTVDKAYEAILSKVDDAERPQARKLLGIIVAASRPLTLQELNVALTIELHHRSYEDLKVDLYDEERFESTVRNMCGLFVTIIDQRIYLIHQTAREFLVAKNKVLDGWKHSLDPVQSELSLATSCIALLMFTDFDDRFEWDMILDGIDPAGISGFEFLGYASFFWTTHFQKGQGQVTDELLQLVLEVCSTSSRRFNIWSRLYRISDRAISMPRFINIMMVASYFGHDTVLEHLLRENKLDIDSKDHEHGRTSLLWAIQQGHLSVVKLLVGTGKADVNSKDNEGRTPLWLACRTRQEDMALFLLENDADPMYKTAQDLTALFESASRGLPKVIAWILRSASHHALQMLTEQYDSSGKSILNLAILSENGSQYPIVKMVIDALGPFPGRRRKLLYHQDHSNCSPLFHAALKNQPQIIKLLVEVDKGLLSQTGWFDWRDTPLHVAAHWQNLNAVQALIDSGANPDIQQRIGHTPLHIASLRPDVPDGVQILKILLKRADPLISTDLGENIIHLVLNSDNAIHFRTIADHIPYPILHQLATSKNKKGDIPLLDATAKFGHEDLDYISRSQTFKAVCEVMVKIIAEADADAILNLVREQDRPIALHRFIETGSDDLVAEIIPKFAALDRSLLDSKDIHAQTPLMKSVYGQQRRTIQLLLDNSANVNAQDYVGKTALHYAVEHDIPDVAELLVCEGADLNIKDNFDHIPVDWCSSRNACLAIVKPKNRPTSPNPVGIAASIRSSRSSWSITLGARLDSCAWNLCGERDWYSADVPTIVHEDKYLISKAIPNNIKLPVSRVLVVIEGRDQGWSDDRWFADRPEGAFESESTYALAILRNDQVVLKREWARNKHRSKTPHRFECNWYSDSARNRDHVNFAGRNSISSDDQGDFVRRLTVGDKVAILSLADGDGWMNITKSALIEIFFED